VLNVPAAIDEVLTSVLGVTVDPDPDPDPAPVLEGGGGILPKLAASDSCLLLTSAREVDGPEENRFLRVPRKPSFVGGFDEFFNVDSDALVLTD
jgi:hypothetical protein